MKYAKTTKKYGNHKPASVEFIEAAPGFDENNLDRKADFVTVDTSTTTIGQLLDMFAEKGLYDERIAVSPGGGTFDLRVHLHGKGVRKMQTAPEPRVSVECAGHAVDCAAVIMHHFGKDDVAAHDSRDRLSEKHDELCMAKNAVLRALDAIENVMDDDAASVRIRKARAWHAFGKVLSACYGIEDGLADELREIAWTLADLDCMDDYDELDRGDHVDSSESDSGGHAAPSDSGHLPAPKRRDPAEQRYLDDLLVYGTNIDCE